MSLCSISPYFPLCSPAGIAKFFHNGVSLRKDAVSASIFRVRRILRWFESQQKLTFYASSLLFVYEGLPSPSSSAPLSSLFSTPSISPTVGKIAMLSSESGQDGEGNMRQEAGGQDEKEVEYNNNSIQVSVPWGCSLTSIYTNHTEGGHCGKGRLRGNSVDAETVEVTVRAVSGENAPAAYEEDAREWTAEPQRPPNGNGNKSQLEKGEEGGETEDSSWRREREGKLKEHGLDGAEGCRSEPDVEVRMIDFAHVFASESRDHGYIYGLKHLLMVLEQILCEAA